MKQRETALKNIVSRIYNQSYSPKLSLGSLSTDQYSELMRVYKVLGGILVTPPVNFGPWDIVTENFIIELDEEQHFNRYRKQTLTSSLYQKWPWFNVKQYTTFCDEQEDACLKKAKRGGYWANESTIRQFGQPSANGVFAGNGSPRWKQRAFYDYCRDLFAMVNHKPVFRFAIYDNLPYNGKSIQLGHALDLNLHEPIKHFLNQKIKA
jgi:hypothetical protein